ncbi:hypothetical protein B0J13DRAFT_617020 [Dactylonectria estremocensis]|uniref:BZIP domain-containing protein n=1 Tax=Dactylonectria estremocensis TaxID=1079267 RepID=A0A9P9JB97_9HYPO|nr:hypothetical protein B0J13DRAFT_617020 [Dactylonectria estremocensis]
MRPQRENKRPRYAESPESPDSAAIEESEATMTSELPQRKRTRYEESPRQQLGYRLAPTGLPLALPLLASPTPGPSSYMTSASPSSARAQTATPLAQRLANAPLLIGGSYTLETAGLAIPPNIPINERLRRQAEMGRELAFQEANPPALPASRIGDLPPKPAAQDWIPFPKEMTKKEEDEIVDLNNEIAKINQRIERERNNQAAKKSRQKRLEALGDTRLILNGCSAECSWWRMRAMAGGASANEWDLVPQQVKDGMVKTIEQRVAAVDEVNETARKQEEARKRLDRTKARAALKEEHDDYLL